MLFGNHVQDTRPFFFLSWKKYNQGEPLSALEQQVVKVILDHPEYHDWFATGGEAVSSMMGDHPFLHLGLHLAIRDQVALDRPAGISSIYHALLLRHGTPHDVEHLMMEPLATCLWEASRLQRMPDEAAYLNACKELCSHG